MSASEGDRRTTGDPPRADVLDPQVLAELREMGGDDEPGLVEELIGIFLEDAPQRMTDLRRALAEGDLGLLERAAHTLKSSCANIGARGLSELCREMERRAREGRVEGFDDLLGRSGAAYAEVERALRGWVA